MPDLPLEESEQALGLSHVVDLLTVERGAGRDRPTQLGAIRLVPPAVQNADVETSVRARLHATRAARLQEAAWIVQPHVRALDKVAGKRDVVVLHEDDSRLFAGQGHDAGDDVFTGLVSRVGLAGEEDLHRSLRIAEKLRQACPVSEQEIGALVGGKTAAETNRQRI